MTGSQDSDLMETVRKRLGDIAAYKERYIAAWFAATGLTPEESVLVQTADGRIWVDRKRDKEHSLHSNALVEEKYLSKIRELKERNAELEAKLEAAQRAKKSESPA